VTSNEIKTKQKTPSDMFVEDLILQEDFEAGKKSL